MDAYNKAFADGIPVGDDDITSKVFFNVGKTLDDEVVRLLEDAEKRAKEDLEKVESLRGVDLEKKLEEQQQDDIAKASRPIPEE